MSVKEYKNEDTPKIHLTTENINQQMNTQKERLKC